MSEYVVRVSLAGVMGPPGPSSSIPPVTTLTRPDATGLIAGFCVFDKTLNKPIWVNGASTAWVDATGTEV